MTLPCVGAPSGTYTSTRFWQRDALQTAAAGSVLVSGGGDGGLQDFLRALTQLDGARLLLDALLRRNAVADAINRVVPDLLAHEAQAARSLAWNDPSHPSDDRPVLDRLHKSHERAVQAVYGSAGADVKAVLAANTPGDAWLLHSQSYFTQCYALNRFLVMLLREYFDRSGGSQRIVSGLKLNSLRKHGAQYELNLSGPTPAALPLRFDTVVIRHGIKPPVKPFPLAPLAVQRQTVPFQPS